MKKVHTNLAHNPLRQFNSPSKTSGNTKSSPDFPGTSPSEKNFTSFYINHLQKSSPDFPTTSPWTLSSYIMGLVKNLGKNDLQKRGEQKLRGQKNRNLPIPFFVFLARARVSYIFEIQGNFFKNVHKRFIQHILTRDHFLGNTRGTYGELFQKFLKVKVLIKWPFWGTHGELFLYN